MDENITNKLTNAFGESILKRFGAKRLNKLVSEALKDNVDDAVDDILENPNSSLGKTFTITLVKLNNIETSLEKVQGDTKYIRKTIDKKFKLLERALASGGARGGSQSPFDNFSSNASALAGSKALRAGTSGLATKMTADIAKVGSTFYRNPMLVKFIKGLEKVSKASKYASVVAIVILNATEPLYAMLEHQPPEVIRTEIVGAIANTLGVILGAEAGTIAGGGVGAFFGGGGAIPGAVIGFLLGGVLGYFAGESSEALAEAIWWTIIEGGDIEKTIKQVADRRPAATKTTPKTGRVKNWRKAKAIAESGSLSALTDSAVRAMTSSSAPASTSSLGNQPIIISPFTTALTNSRIFNGVDSAMGKYLTEQTSTGSARGSGSALYPGQTGAGEFMRPGEFGPGGGSVSTTPMSPAMEAIVNDLAKGRTIANSSLLAGLTDEQLASVGIQRSTMESPERRGFSASSYKAVVSDADVMKSMYQRKGGDSLEAQAFNYFMSQGWTKVQTAAILGNIKKEGGFKKSVIEGNERGDGGRAMGIAQWHPDRQAKFQEIMGMPLKGAPFEKQLEFYQWELNHTHKTAGNLLRKSTDPYTAAEIVNRNMEISGDYTDERGKNAAAYLDKADSYIAQGQLNTSEMTASEKARLFAVKKEELARQKMANLGSMQPTTAAVVAAPVSITGKRVIQSQAELAKTRKGALSPEFEQQMEELAARTGVEFEVVSGGQRMEGAPGHVGDTHNHDRGWAGDTKAYAMVDGKRTLLDIRNPVHRKKILEIAQTAAAMRINGFGMSEGYMGPNTMHIGGGDKNDPDPKLRGIANRPRVWHSPSDIQRAYETGVTQRGTLPPLVPQEKVAKTDLTVNPNAYAPIETPIRNDGLMEQDIEKRIDDRIRTAFETAIKPIQTKLDSVERATVANKEPEKDKSTKGITQSEFNSRVAGKPEKPISAQKNDAIQKVPDWVYNPTIYTPIPTTNQ